MQNKNIVLIGFMGSGKTVISKKLAQLLKKEAISTDALIEKREGRKISRIFQESGEAYFRKVEKEVVNEVSVKRGVILDCGGGVVLDPDNLTNLKKNGVLIYLSISPGMIYKRIKDKKHRPLLNVEDPQAKIKELLEARKPHYAQADYIVDADEESIEVVCHQIMKLLGITKER